MQPGRFGFSVDAKGYARWWSPDALHAHQRRQIDNPNLNWQRNFDDLEFDVSVGAPQLVTIELEPAAKVTGTVIDPDGKPVAGATVAPALTGTGNSLTGDTRFSVRTKDDGTFEALLPASNDATYNLVAHDGKYGQWRNWANGVLEPMQTKPGEEIKDVTIQLTRGATVRGRVIDAQGNPVAGRDVRASAADRMENRYYDPTTKTGDDDRYELKFVRPGDHYIQVDPFWLDAAQAPGGSQSVTLAADEVKEGVDLVAAPPRD